MTTAKDNTTGEEASPVAKAIQQVALGMNLIAAVPEHPEAKGPLLRVASKYFIAAAQGLEAASRS